uniref:ABC transporter domain-containing protein n=2 Tax=Chrysotila carterae TaxID=13221 RepID=A0A6S9WCX1_CHRCT
MGAAEDSVTVKSLWFSYEIAENISSTAKPDTRVLRDGGCSIDMPRAQHVPGTQAAYKLQLRDVSMALPRGARCMLLGANGAGKSTLMSVIGGRHLVEEESAMVLGRPAFHDTSLASRVALLTGNWTHTVSFVGHNVPYQAMEVSRLIASHSVGVDPERVRRLVQLLEVDEKWNLTTVSDGQRRRVQILCKLIKPCEVLLLDEITTDLDLLARQDLLQFLREESEERGVCTIYCTHIFDGLDGWPTHIAYLSGGEMVFCKPIEMAVDLLEVPEEMRLRGWGRLFCAVQRMLLEQMPRYGTLISATPTASCGDVVPKGGPAIAVHDLSWGYTGAKSAALHSVSFELERGVRCLLVGANGAGKTTLLKLLGGKHMLPRGTVDVLGYSAFHDTELNTLTSLLSGDWTRQVACVGNGVPFQADFSMGFMVGSFVEVRMMTLTTLLVLSRTPLF